MRPTACSVSSSSTKVISFHRFRGISFKTSGVMTSPFLRQIFFLFGSTIRAPDCLPCNRALTSFLTISVMIRISSSRSFCSIAAASSSIYCDLRSFSAPFRVKILASITVPSTPGGTRSEVSLTSLAFSPNIARSSFSSEDNWVSPLGVILPTRISPALTETPIRTIPLSSRLRSASSPTFGISLVISSLPSFVSLAMVSNSSM
ncbi:MAG: hypothetical protein A4E72_01845 [Syntrophus sp. PtaU1.Bin208]|nr:MAG: hypothetical protein A4E72_01845 [Syntrophus sp. PtaU1.Bin208]